MASMSAQRGDIVSFGHINRYTADSGSGSILRVGGGAVIQFSRQAVSSPDAVLRTGTPCRFTIDPDSPHNSLRASRVWA